MSWYRRVPAMGSMSPLPKQELDGAQVGSGLEEMDREGMAKGMCRDDLSEARGMSRTLLVLS